MKKIFEKIKEFFKVDRNRQIFVSIMMLFLIFGIFIVNKKIDVYLRDKNVTEITYIDFKDKVKNKEIEEVNINLKESEFYATDKEENIYEVQNPKTDNFKEYLLENNIKVEETPDRANKVGIILSLFQTFITMALIVWLMKKTMPETKTTMLNKEDSTIKFENVEGIDEAKRDIKVLVDFLKNPKEYEKRGARMPKGVILYGPPGTGKTLTAKAIAGEAGVPFYSVSGSDFMEMFVGLGARRVRDLYAEAKENAPCIVFIDEIDAVGKKRGSANNSEMDQTINALLTELDGFTGSEGIITIAATNRIEDLDTALIRPGRFDKQIAIPLPDKMARKRILEVHSKNKEFDEDVSLDELAAITINFSGAGLESLLNEATIISINNKHDKITKQDIDDAHYKIVMKGNKKDNQSSRDSKELELVAWHEAGHALLTKLLTDDEVSKVTILASTSGAGGVTFSTPEEMSLYSKEYIESKIAIMYGGRIAEYLLLGDENLVTTGASNDIQQATRLIKGYINHYGMSELFGMINIDELFGSQSSQLGANELVLKEAQAISEKIYNQALKILSDNKDILEAIAKKLLENETIDNDEMNEIIEQYKIIL